MRLLRVFFLLLAASLWLRPGGAVADDIRQERVGFKAGASSATIKGSLKGYETIDYLLGAKAGQSMSVSLKTSNRANYFNVLPPGSETALFVGSSGGDTWTGTLPADGDYTVRVYLMRSAARRGETANYTLTLGITGKPADAATSGESWAGDAKVPGTPYHATGTLPCSIGPDPKGSAQCQFGVIRHGPGKAEVHVTTPGGEERVLVFAGSQVTTPDASARLAAAKQNGDWSISINEYEFYQVPDAVIVGG